LRRNVLAPTFCIAPDAPDRAKRGERLLADAPRGGLLTPPVDWQDLVGRLEFRLQVLR
jgi:hypothetical protein